MKTAVTALIVGMTLAGPAWASDREKTPRCSVRALAGAWVFGTDAGQIAGVGGITAVGTLNIDRKGQVSGKYDYTIAQLGFFAGNAYTGTVTVNPDCTGTITFEDESGGGVSSIVIASSDEFWGISQDPGILWTVRARRISMFRNDD
jgi:hypothetical protein